MNWRSAKALVQLRAQIDAAWPNRGKDSDGTIGDADHASRTSDHNPWVMDGKTGVVTGFDFTNDPRHGVVSDALAHTLVAGRDPRVKYVISNGQIANSAATGGSPAWAWRKYTGKNRHDHHFHISVKPDKKFYDDARPWDLNTKSDMFVPVIDAPAPLPVLRKGSKGDQVIVLQRLLAKAGVTGPKGKPLIDDGDYWDRTEYAVSAFQKKMKLAVDGRAGPQVWNALGVKTTEDIKK